MTRSRASAKQAGARFERLIADWLAERLNDDRIDRRVKVGANDKGDIANVRLSNNAKVVIETKDYGGIIKTAEWLKEAETERQNDNAHVGVVIAKRRGTTDPAEQVVIMTTEMLARLIEVGNNG